MIVVVHYVLDYRVNLNPRGVYILLSEFSGMICFSIYVIFASRSEPFDWLTDTSSLSVLFHQKPY